MTLVGLAARKLSEKKRNAKLAAAFPNGVRCQKCLELGHWSYECKAEKRKYSHRSSRTKQLNKRVDEKAAVIAETSELGKRDAVSGTTKAPKEKRCKHGTASSSSSSSDDSDSDDNTDSESSSNSDSGSDSNSSSYSSSESSSSSSSSSSSDEETTTKNHLKKTKIENKTSSSASSNEGNDN